MSSMLFYVSPLFVLLSFAFFSESIAWTRPFTGEDIAWRLSRRSYCKGPGGKCFSSESCCKGYVCAAFDDYFGLNAESPGYCVLEKHLQSCLTDADCDAGSGKCHPLGRNKALYCLIDSSGRIRGGVQGAAGDTNVMDDAVIDNSVMGNEVELPGAGYKTAKYGLGEKCVRTSDCKEWTRKGDSRLCCKDVRLGRQISRICDRILDISGSKCLK